MPFLQDLPNHVLSSIISFAIEATRFRGWQLSLRSVSHQFNDAVLHECFVQRRLFTNVGSHSLDCMNPCHECFCRAYDTSHLKYVYAFRFSFQGLLTVRHLEQGLPYCDRQREVLSQWRLAHAALRRLEIPKRLDADQSRFYSACTSDPIFADTCSAVLAHAIRSYVGDNPSLNASTALQWGIHCGTAGSVFLVALAACVLDDLPLLQDQLSKLPQPFEGPSTVAYPPALTPTEEHLALLRVATSHGSLSVMDHLLEAYPRLASESWFDGVLRAAIFSDNQQALACTLKHTPKLSVSLTHALYRWPHLLPKSESSSTVIRSLARHFSPLSPRSRAWLIIHACAVDDLRLLDDFLADGPLFDCDIYDAGGRQPRHLQFAIRSGSVQTVRYLLAQGIVQTPRNHRRLITLIELSLCFNQIESYRELRLWIDAEHLEPYFTRLALAEDSADVMSEWLSKWASDSDLGPRIFETYGQSGRLMPSAVQRALVCAVRRLRHGNVRFLLSLGARLLPDHLSSDFWQEVEEKPFEIPWPYFNTDRDAFRRTQDLLDAVGLPKMRVLV